MITAAAGDIRAGKVIVDKDGEPLTGTLVDNGSWSSSGLAAGASVTIPAGIHDGTGTVTAKSLADQTPGNLAAAKMLSGVYGYSNGTKVTGNIASMAAQTVTPGNTAKTVSCNGKYMTGNVTVSAVANLTAANIKKGVTVGGVTGTWEGYVAAATDLYYKGANSLGFVGSNDQSTSYKFEATYIQIASLIAYANSVTLTGGKNFQFAGYKTLYLEFYVNKPSNEDGVWIEVYRDSMSSSNKLIQWTPNIKTTGNQTLSISLAAHQSSWKLILKFVLRGGGIQVTRIRVA